MVCPPFVVPAVNTGGWLPMCLLSAAPQCLQPAHMLASLLWVVVLVHQWRDLLSWAVTTGSQLPVPQHPCASAWSLPDALPWHDARLAAASSRAALHTNRPDHTAFPGTGNAGIPHRPCLPRQQSMLSPCNLCCAAPACPSCRGLYNLVWAACCAVHTCHSCRACCACPECSQTAGSWSGALLQHL